MVRQNASLNSGKLDHYIDRFHLTLMNVFETSSELHKSFEKKLFVGFNTLEFSIFRKTSKIADCLRDTFP